jgi:hypothetical protein
MALTSIDISITNNNLKGYVEINSTKTGSASSAISYVLISRRKHGLQYDYTRIYEKVINNVNQLTFSDNDLSVKSGETYDYYIELTDGISSGYTTIEFGEIENVACWFDGLFVGNEDGQYFAPLDCDTTTTRVTQASYVMTLAGRTPYRVSNSSANYTTGQSSGLFVPFDEDNTIEIQQTKEYIKEVLDFLTDGTEKILKTSAGEAWYVAIDPDVSVTSDDHYIGSSKIEFNWTETGDIPEIKKVVSE